MSKRLNRVQSGRLVCAVCYTAHTTGDAPKVRAQKRKSSTLARETLNARFSYQKLERVLAANFDDGDLFVTATYDDDHLPADRDMAVRKIRRFLSLLRKRRKGRGEKLHYIYVTERKTKHGDRLHHHLVINSTGADGEDLKSLWVYGNIQYTPLTITPQESYEDLAGYLTKEPRKFNTPCVGERTWQSSIGLYRPEPDVDDVPDDVTLTAPPGAYIIANEGPVRNGYGEYSWIKYLLPTTPERKRPPVKRNRKKKK